MRGPACRSFTHLSTAQLFDFFYIFFTSPLFESGVFCCLSKRGFLRLLAAEFLRAVFYDVEKFHARERGRGDRSRGSIVNDSLVHDRSVLKQLHSLQISIKVFVLFSTDVRTLEGMSTKMRFYIVPVDSKFCTKIKKAGSCRFDPLSIKLRIPGPDGPVKSIIRHVRRHDTSPGLGINLGF